MSDEHNCAVIDYTSWRGLRKLRLIRPIKLLFGSNEWHPEQQWMIEAEDVEGGTIRTFALKDIHSWKPASP